MTQVISAIDFVTAKINHGEEPTPSVLNRPLLASMDADARLEESVQYIARSIDLIITENTKFLVHGDTGVDLVGGIQPEVTASLAETFVYDSFFYGSAFIQSACTNLLSSITNFDSSLTTLNGWTTSTAGNANTSIMVNRRGLTITNKSVVGIIAAGLVSYVSPTTAVTAGNKVSFGVELATEDNLERLLVTAGLTVTFKNAINAVVSTQTVTTVANKYRGILGLENITVPTGATKASTTVYVNYGSTTGKAAVTFKNVMLEVSPVLHTWTKTTRAAANLKYTSSVKGGPKLASVIGWAKFNTNALANHVGPIGPMFLVNAGNTFNIGAVHDSADGSNLKLKLRMISGGKTSYGNTITIPNNNRDTYLPCMIRLSEIVDGTTKMRIEFVIVDLNLTVYKSTIEVPTFALPTDLDLRLGSDQNTTEQFNGPVTEFRYDVEWINDFEFIIMALSRRPFDLGDNGINMDTLRKYLDATGVNLIVNPVGKLGLYHWANVPSGKFRNTVIDKVVGSGFLWFGGACSTDTYIQSDPIVVDGGGSYVYRGKLGSQEGSTGNFGIAVQFFTSSGTQTGATVSVLCSNGLDPDYYVVNATAPSDATTAKVSMFVGAGFNSTRATWSKLKFEKGIDGTLFTDDSTPSHALLAP